MNQNQRPLALLRAFEAGEASLMRNDFREAGAAFAGFTALLLRCASRARCGRRAGVF
jgi:hypothetical protein